MQQLSFALVSNSRQRPSTPLTLRCTLQELIVPLSIARDAPGQVFLPAAAKGVAVGLLGLGTLGVVVWRTERESVAGVRALLRARKIKEEREKKKD